MCSRSPESFLTWKQYVWYFTNLYLSTNFRDPPSAVAWFNFAEISIAGGPVRSQKQSIEFGSQLLDGHLRAPFNSSACPFYLSQLSRSKVEATTRQDEGSKSENPMLHARSP